MDLIFDQQQLLILYGNPGERFVQVGMTLELYHARVVPLTCSVPLSRSPIGKGFGAFYRDMRAVNSAVSESKAEAAGLNQEMIQQLQSILKDESGYMEHSATARAIADKNWLENNLDHHTKLYFK